MLQVTLSARQCSVAVLAIALALQFKLLLDFTLAIESFFLLFFAAVIASVWYGGRKAGLLATALAAGLSDYFFLSPTYSFFISSPRQSLCLELFVIEGVMLSSLSATLLSTQQRTEERFRSSVESMLDCFGIYTSVRDSSGQIVDFTVEYVNAAACANNLMTKEEQIGQRLGDLLPAHQRTGLLAEYAQVVETGQPLIKESLFYEDVYSRRQLVRAYDVRAVKLGDGFAATWRDITQRKQNEESLQTLTRQLQQRTADLAASKVQMQRVLDHIPAFIHIIGLDGRIQFTNAKWRELPSQVEGSFIGCHINEVFTPEETEKFLHQNQKVAAANQVVTFESEVVLPDGVHTFLDVKFPLVEPTGEVQAICGIAIDMTDRKRIETVLRRSEQRLRAVVDNVPLGLYTADSQGCEFVNQYWLSRMGLNLEEAQGMGWTQVVHPEDREWVVQESKAAQNVGQAFKAEYRFLDRNGNVYWMLDRSVPIRDETNQVQFYQGFLVDITEHKQVEEELRRTHDELEMRVQERTAELVKANLELQTENMERQRAEEAVRQSEERFRSLSACSPVGIFLTDVNGYCTYTNPRCRAICGCSSEEALGAGWARFIHPDDREWVAANWSAHAQTGQECSQEYRFLGQGIERWVYERTSPMFSAQGELLGHVGTIEDITERKLAEAQLLQNAFYDVLTGLPNRALFMNRLQHALEYSKRHENNLFAVLFLDLDRFKVINDSLGHTFGDQLLVGIASRLQSCLRSADTAARLGGDEFTVLLEDIKDVSDVLHVAERIQAELALPFNLGGQEVFTTTSIGIALSYSHKHPTGDAIYDETEELLRDADAAMYRAKELGKARYELFNPDMHADAVARLQLETDLRRAIDRQEFRVYYQPIVALISGKISGFEALVRWQHPDRGLVAPADFISVAEETGLIVPIGCWVLQEACRQMRAWLELRANLLQKMSVNLSIKQFSQPDLIGQIEQVLRQSGLDACFLELELTESVIMKNGDEAVATLSQLKELGIRLSIDDFGTGYSSLGRIHSFPISMLKIDRSFVSSMGAVSRNSSMTEAIITLAHKLGVDVTAEGVETKEQLALLRKLKCEYGQGFFFSQPLESEAAKALITANPQW